MITRSTLPRSNVQAMAEQAQSLSEPLERGQSHRPITDALRSLTESRDTCLVVSILCLDAAAGETLAVQAKAVSESNRTLECRIATCRDLLEDITAYQNFCRGSHALLVASSAANPLEPPQLELVRSLSGLFALAWPVVVDGFDQGINPGSDQGIGKDAAWITIVQEATRGACLARGAVSANSPSKPAWPEHLQPFHEPLLLFQRSSSLSILLEKVVARAENELAYLTLVQSRMEVPAKNNASRGNADTDKELVPLRDRLAEQSATIDRQLTLKSERSTQPLGELSAMIRSVCSSINVDDLEQTRSSSLLKLSVNASHLAHLNRRIEHALRQEFVNDLQQVQRQMRRATDELLATLCMRLGAGVQVTLPMLDVNHAWRSVENLMAIGKETHIELARKGFFDVLTAGRQKVFIIIMFASLMGRMGLPNLFNTPGSKAAFGMFMGVVMIVSMVCAILHWRREKELTSEKELNKIRDSMQSEGSKVVDQVERVKLATMRDYLKEVARTFECTVKQSLEQNLASQRARREAELQRQEVLRKSLDARHKQVSDIQRQAAKLLEQMRGTATAAMCSLQEAALRWPSMSAVTTCQGTAQSIHPIANQNTAVSETPAEPQSNLRSDLTEETRTTVQRPARPTRLSSSSAQSGGASALAERRQRRELARTSASDN